MKELVIQYSRGDSFASSVIARLTHSAWSHVDYVVPGEGLLGVSGADKATKDPGGVLVRSFEPWPYLRKVQVTIKTDKADAIIRRGMTQLGKPFDHSALFDFLSDKPGDRDWRDLASWFCAEWCTWSVEMEQFFPYELVVAKNRVTPADHLIIMNPFMTPEDIKAVKIASEFI